MSKKSLQEFREWSVRRGQVGNPGTGSYPGQCVSLIQQYLYQVFAIPYTPRGHAKDFVPPTFRRMPMGTVPKPGDIIRYQQPYGYIGGVFYGHIGMIDDEGRYLDQNGVVLLHVGRRAYPFVNYEVVFRPTQSFKLKKPAPRKTNDQIANDIIAGRGNWGNGATRIRKLSLAGYNPVTIQRLINQKLTARSRVYHTVKRGETLSSIAKRYNVSVAQIVKLNKIRNQNLIYPGQSFRIK